MNRFNFGVLILFGFILFLFAISQADIIRLKDGGEIEGEITEEAPESIRVKTKIGHINVSRERIESIEKKEIPEEISTPTEKAKKEEAKPKKATKPAEPKANIIVPTNYPTIKEAIEASKSGDVIFISPGEYEEKNGLMLKSDIILIGGGADTTKIKIGQNGLKFEDIQTRTAVSKVTIKNLTFLLQGEPITLNYAKDVELKNCIITGAGHIGIVILAGKKIEITNCTISGFYSGVSLWRGPSDVTIRNSILAGNSTYNIYVEEQKDEVMAELKDRKLSLFYNNLWGAMENYHNCAPGEFDISQNPQFLGGGDYRLQSGSPCINAGDPDPKYNDPDGTRGDLGALPFTQIESNN